MANVTVNGQDYTGVEEVLLPVTGGGGTEQRFVMPPSGTKSITANGTHDVSGYASASVNVPSDAPVTQEKTVTPTAAGTVVTPDSGKLLSKVTVNGDADLIAGNIKSGVEIFGVTGTYEGGSTVQTHTGTFTSAATPATPVVVNCGFMPDVVVVDLGTDTVDGITYHAALTFPLFVDRVNWIDSIAWSDWLPNADFLQVYGNVGNQTQSGFSIVMTKILPNFATAPYQTTLAYTAYKFL